MLTRHEFLAELHRRLSPEVYLETGVQTGGSLVLAERAGIAVGIDPDLSHLNPANRRPNQRLYEQTADEYFGCDHCERPLIDLAFIDGSHLFEDALNDFVNVEIHSHRGTIVMFDDVLPYNQAIATRVQPPGDWTGDAWKILEILGNYRPDLHQIPVNLSATGALVVVGFDGPRWDELGSKAHRLRVGAGVIADRWRDERPVPDEIINRTFAWDADQALDWIEKFRADIYRNDPVTPNESGASPESEQQ